MDLSDAPPDIKGEGLVMPSIGLNPPVPEWKPLPPELQASSTPDEHPQATSTLSATPSILSTTVYRPQFSLAAIKRITSSSLQQQAQVIKRDASAILHQPAKEPGSLTFGRQGEPDLDSLPKTVSLPLPTLNPATKRKRQNHEPSTVVPEPVAAPLAGSVTPVARDFPVIEKPAVRKKKSCADAILVCEKCHTTSNVSHNPMMVCKGCFEALHRMCGDPSHDSNDYVCHLCSKEREELEQYKRLVAEQQAEKQLSRAYYSIENQRNRNMAGFSRFNKPQNVGFFAGESTHEEVSCLISGACGFY